VDRFRDKGPREIIVPAEVILRRLIVQVFLFSSLALLFGGCQRLGIVIKGGRSESKAGAIPLPAYSGPKARIAVAAFEVKSEKSDAETGAALRDMLLSGIVNSGRFAVLDLPAVQETPTSGVNGALPAGQKEKQLPSADLIITVSVNEFEPQASGGREGLGGGGGVSSGVLGGLLGASVNKAHVALEIRIVNAANSEVVASNKVQGQASDVSIKSSAGTPEGWILGGVLSRYSDAPMENAIRSCMVEAVRYIVQAVPANYYKYQE